jgi:hypothetical protein
MPDPSPHYFDDVAKEMGIADLAPSEIHEELGEVPGLKHGPTASRLGGRVTTDLKRLTPEEFAQRHEESEQFLKQKRIRYKADERQARLEVSGSHAHGHGRAADGA